MSSPLSAVFATAREEHRAALIGYLPAGYPSVDGSVAALRAMVAGGVDIVEVGLPYSDPLMDGPVIQAAVDRALSAGTRVDDVFEVVRRVADDGVPVLVMTYWNPVERRGVSSFAAELAAAGAAGAITPDLTPEEAGDWLAATAANSLDPVFLVAPSSTDVRIATVGRVSRGFVYAASTMGVTGPRDQVGDRAPRLVERVRALLDLPVAVGLGVSTGAAAREVAGYADGVIVGSAFVRRIAEAGEDSAARAAGQLAEELAGALRG
jgi:tryptophan synthase alpha chain